MLTRLGVLAPRMSGAADSFARYDKAARAVIDNTVLDASYGVLMMGEAETNFAQLRRALGEASARAETRRDSVAAVLLAELAHMRVAFLALVSAGAVVSTVTDNAVEVALTFPAASVALTAMLCTPSARVDAVMLQAPAAVATAVPITAAPSSSVSLMPTRG